MKLNQVVWHGRDYPEGTEIFHTEAPIKGDRAVFDKHGCASNWFTTEGGSLINAWDCEVSA